MIDPVSTQLLPQTVLRPAGPEGLERITPARPAQIEGAGEARSGSFADLVGGLVDQVNAKAKAAEGEVRRLMVGESDNIHQSMIAMQESSLSFTLLVEVRNKLVESYQELMRMTV